MEQERREAFSLLFLEQEKVKEILRKASDSLSLPVSDEIVEEVARLIDLMKEDLIQLYSFPLHNSPVFNSHDSLSLKDLDKIYEECEVKLGAGSTLAKPVT